MDRITFLAPYPDEKNSKDGMVQRIKHIDDQFKNYPRTYIDISLRRHLKKEVINHNDLLKEYKLNAVIHFFMLFKLLANQKLIYIHSVYRFIWPVIQLLSSSAYKCLDVHGVVPEENKLMNGWLSYLYFNLFEFIAFKNISHVVYVTESMEAHYKEKFPKIRPSAIIYNIYPNIVAAEKTMAVDNPSNKTIIIYSGNTQKWQNVDEMIEVMAKNQQSNLHYIILTGDIPTFKEKIEASSLNMSNIELLSVQPHELSAYYQRAHYGFILRDESVINKVANPTKMIEYLMFGIIPIVKTPGIGDFYRYGYDYIPVTTVSTHLKPIKSAKNVRIASAIANSNNNKNLVDFLLNE